MSTGFVVIVFALTYLGMAIGRVPGLKVDRTGIALLGAATLLAGGVVDARVAASSIDLATLVLMFGLMILSAQFGEAGLYAAASARIAAAAASPRRLLALTVIVAGVLSAVLVNDIVVFAMTPMLCRGLMARGLNPRPYLVALAGAGNAGSAATLIGNPQNILIGQVGALDFWDFFAVCAPPAAAGLVCVYVAVALIWRRELAAATPEAAGPALPIDRPATFKALAASVVLLLLFALPLPREIAALAVAALLLLSRTIASRHLIAAVDWHLLLLIACLFVVTSAFAATGIAANAMQTAAAAGWTLDNLGVLSVGALIVSNTIGNVPATVLILALWPELSTQTLYGLAVLSTLAGNLLIVGSLCNLIVAERAATCGIRLGFTDFARAGAPMTLASMAIAAAWLAAI